MSGKKQHYIPQVLLRGFSSDHGGKRRRSWVYKGGRPPYSSSILDIAAQRYFYSDLGQGTSERLDDRITHYENRLGKLLSKLREAADGQSVDALVSAEVVAHLSIRGAYLREIFSSGVHELLEGASSRLSDLETARNILGVDEHANKSLLANRIDGELDKLKDWLPSGLPVLLIRRIILHSIREDFGNLYEQVLPSIGEAFRQLACEIPAVLRGGHAKALVPGMAPDNRVYDLANLSWHVYQSSTALILPDCVAIGIEKCQTAAQPYLLAKVDSIAAIMLPITSSQILIGCPLDAAFRFDASQFNSHAARCSTVFFVSSENSEALRTLAGGIGSVTYKTINGLVSESLERTYPGADVSKGVGEGQGSAGCDSTDAEDCSRADQIPNIVSYQVSFRGCATQEQAEAIAKAVGVVVASLTPYLELSSLEAVIFTGDYAATIKDLAREIKASSEIETTCVDGLIGIATTVSVVRDGKPASHIVMKSWLGHGLLSAEERDVRVASHALSTMLSQVAFLELFRSAFRNGQAEPAFSSWESLLFGPMSNAPAAYFAAWMSAEIDPTAADSYREVVLRTLEHADSLIGVERFAYATHGDLDRFLSTATGALGGLLVSVAKLLGHSDACNESIYDEDNKLNAVFGRQGLREWVSLYGRDLRRVFSSRGKWRALSELSFLGAHMERQLWRYLVFPWLTEDGHVRVEVPYIGDRRFD